MNDISRSLRWLLGLLIATNVALLTVVVLFVARQSGAFAPRGEIPGGRLDTPAWLGEALPPAERERVAAVIESHRDDIRQQRFEVHRARRELGALMRRSEIDKQELNSAFARLRDAEHALAEVTQNALAEVLVDLEPRQRMRVARMIMVGRGRGPQRPREGMQDRESPDDRPWRDRRDFEPPRDPPPERPPEQSPGG